MWRRAAIVLYIISLVGISSPVNSKTILVDPSFNDCLSVANQLSCGLEQAIFNASDGDELRLAEGLYISTVNIKKNIALIGEGPDKTIFDGFGAATVFMIAPGAIVTLENMTIRNGQAEFGGAIVNHGQLSVQSVSFANNVANKAGGAIYNLGKAASLVVEDSVFTENQALGDNGFNISFGGGAIFNQGQLDIKGSQFFRNRSQENGGAIYTTFRGEGQHSPSIQSSLFQDNIADYGGAVNTRGALNISQTRFVGNRAELSLRASGGAIFTHHHAALYITNSLFKQNQANLHGGAIRFYSLKGGDFKNLTIIDNAVSQGGKGAGIYVLAQTEPLYIQRSLILNNRVGNEVHADCAGSLESRGFNFLRATDGCELSENKSDIFEGEDEVRAGVNRKIVSGQGAAFAGAINCDEGSEFADTAVCYTGALLSEVH